MYTGKLNDNILVYTQVHREPIDQLQGVPLHLNFEIKIIQVMCTSVADTHLRAKFMGPCTIICVCWWACVHLCERMSIGVYVRLHVCNALDVAWCVYGLLSFVCHIYETQTYSNCFTYSIIQSSMYVNLSITC